MTLSKPKGKKRKSKIVSTSRVKMWKALTLTGNHYHLPVFIGTKRYAEKRARDLFSPETQVVFVGYQITNRRANGRTEYNHKWVKGLPSSTVGGKDSDRQEYARAAASNKI